MGLAMAKNLQNHLVKMSMPNIMYFNRTQSRGNALKELGGVPSDGVRELVSGADIIFLSLSDDDALTFMLNSISQAGTLQNKIIVDTTTVHPAISGHAKILCDAKGGSFVAAPVFGASPVAAEGQLLFVLAGPAAAIAQLEPFLVGVLARATLKLGEDVQQASTLKTAG